MPAINFPRVSSGMNAEQLADLVARCLKEVEWLANGNMDSRNIRNIAGYNVGPTDLKHSSGIVGMSGANPTDNNAIRFWSGNANPAIASFRVTQGGVLTAVGMVLQSSSSGERVVLDSTGLHTYNSSGVERMTIGTGPTRGIKAITGRDTSGVEQSVYTYDTTTFDGVSRTGQYITAHGAAVLLESDGHVRILDANGRGFRIVSGYPEMNDGFGYVPIAKASGISGTVFVASTSGGPTTTAITFTNGVRTS